MQFGCSHEFWVVLRTFTSNFFHSEREEKKNNGAKDALFQYKKSICVQFITDCNFKFLHTNFDSVQFINDCNFKFIHKIFDFVNSVQCNTKK